MKTRNILRRTLSLVLVLTLVFTQMPTVFAAENISITNQPKNYLGTVSSDAVFTVRVAEDGCSYRWQQKSPSASNWTNASGTGTTTPTLTVRVRAALDGYSYRCQIKDSANNVHYSDAATLQVSGSFQIAEQPQNYEGLVGSTAVFAVTTDTENLTYAWQRQLPGSDVWSNTSDSGYRTNTLSVTVRNSVDGYKYRCKITDADGTVVYTEPALLAVRDSFVILSQPESEALMVGETAVFSVATDKDSLSYRWQQKTPTATSWTNSSFTGYNTASLNVKALTRYNGYQFRCMITDANGGVVYSDAATLTVTGTFSITKQPADFVGHVGDTAVFSVQTNSNNLTYCWQYMRPEDTSWRNAYYTGYRTNSMSVKATNSLDGYRFRCQITDADGAVFYTDPATLTIEDSFAILEQPKDSAMIVGDTGIFSVTTDTDGLSYRWQQKTPTSTSWTNSSFSGYNTASLSVKALTRYHDYQFRCMITDANGGVVYSEAATLTVSGTFSITKQPEDFTGLVGDTAVFAVETNSNNLTYYWQYMLPGDSTWRNANYSGNRTSSVSMKITNSLDGYQLRCKITDADGSVFYTDAAKLIVQDSFRILEQPQNCSAAENETILLTVSTDTDGLTYRWQQMAPNATTWRNSNFTGYNKPSLQVKMNKSYDGYKFRCMITDANGGVVYSDPATVTLRTQTALEITQQPVSATASVGETVVFQVAANGDGLSYEWQKRAAGSTSWTAATEAGNKTAQLSVAAAESLNGTSYRCKITDAYGNTVYSEAAGLTVTIPATPLEITQQPQDFRGKLGDTAVFMVNAVGDGLSYLWQYRNIAESAWTDAALTGFDTSAISVPVTEDQPQFKYRCVITDTYGNAVYSNEVAVELETIEFVIAKQPEDYYGVAGDYAEFSVWTRGSNLSFRWQRSTSGTDWTNVTDGEGYDSAALYLPINNTSAALQYRCIITDAHGAETITATVGMFILPLPQGYKDAYDYVAAVLTVNERLNDLGLSWDDLSSLGSLSPDFMDELKTLVESEAGYDSYSSEIPFSDTYQLASPYANVQSAALCKAYYDTQVNLSREKKERNEEREVLYMILSHFVDVPGVNYQNMLTPETIYMYAIQPFEMADWITDYDRQAYDIYIDNVHNADVVYYMNQLALSIGSIVGGKIVGSETSNLRKIADLLGSISFGTDVISAGESAVYIIKHANENYTPNEFVELMKKEYVNPPEIGREKAFHTLFDVFEGAVAIASTVVFENPFIFGLYLASKDLSMINGGLANLFKAAAWTSMAQSRNMRISYRYMRYYGML